MNSFMKFWFSGFENAVDEMSVEQRKSLFGHCARACSESFTKAMYTTLYKSAGESISGMLEQLGDGKDVKVETIEPDRVFDIIYTRCLCDLHTCGYVHTSCMCECSRQSLLYNIESLIGEGKAEVELISSILGGSGECRLRLTLL